ncbi:Cyclic nucleotide-gated ion channel 1 [Acorus gramineus]|uniref:Cyclic nucleotide-gated ion channel 1 n=1 Tax=Acorus gramineus TaxID=55184 RepID=A0AAV9BHH7_ACOGR|nr:Cyclic nucleotide-gated ion channel 1 [Acorus gramineus]
MGIRFRDWTSEKSFSSDRGLLGNERKGPSLRETIWSGFRRGVGRIKTSISRFRISKESPKEELELEPQKSVLDPQGPFLQKWNKIFVLSCVLALSVDPLFFYIPVVKGDGDNQCLGTDHGMEITASVLRSFSDIFYILHIYLQFHTGFIAPSSRVFGRGELVTNRMAIAKRYLSSYFLIDVLAVLPLPQTYLQSTTVRIEEMRVKRRDAEQWMSHRLLPDYLRERIRQHEQYRWQETRGVNEENLLQNLPKDLRRDIKRHLCLALLTRVPMFEKMDNQLLDAMCDRLKPALYTKDSFIIREGDPVDEMLFIMRGRLESFTTNGGRTGFFNSDNLKPGDFCGEELLTWALDPHSSSNLPSSTRTVKALSEVEAFALIADDLKFVASQFRRLHSKQLRHTFRLYSPQWRTWAACFIQVAWRRYAKRKLEESLQEEEQLQVALAKGGGSSAGGSPSLGATIYASRFAANALKALRKNGARKARVQDRLPAIMLQKPAEPDFTAEEK